MRKIKLRAATPAKVEGRDNAYTMTVPGDGPLVLVVVRTNNPPTRTGGLEREVHARNPDARVIYVRPDTEIEVLEEEAGP